LIEQRFHNAKAHYLSMMGFCGTRQTTVELFSRGIDAFKQSLIRPIKIHPYHYYIRIAVL